MVLDGEEETQHEELWLRMSAIPAARRNELIYQRFLNGKLIYKPNKDNDIGKVELRIADLANPLQGTFFFLTECLFQT